MFQRAALRGRAKHAAYLVRKRRLLCPSTRNQRNVIDTFVADSRELKGPNLCVWFGTHNVWLKSLGASAQPDGPSLWARAALECGHLSLEHHCFSANLFR